jgi:DNA-directed RNA polymerase subunit RPC12/RpoP
MPIRFRCAYCNQLLSIATRKAGTIIKCPTCAGKVVVPGIETLAGVSSGQDLAVNGSDLPQVDTSEDSTEEAQAKSEVKGEAKIPSAGEAVPPPGSWGTHAEPPYDVEKIHPTPPIIQTKPFGARPGYYLSRRQVTMAILLASILLILAFAAGLVLGYFWAGGTHS